MLAFSRLYVRLDSTTKTSRKLAALEDYFRSAASADAAWAVYFLCGRRFKRLVKAGQLRGWGAAAAGLPDWLFDESYHAVGDLAETLALLLSPQPSPSALPLHEWIEDRLARLAVVGDDEKRAILVDAWQSMDHAQRLVFNKLITGGFRVGVSQQLVMRALATVSGQSPAGIAHRLMGDWQPSSRFYEELLAGTEASGPAGTPYPFLLAHPLEAEPATLGPIADWLAEWKWDGIRAQLLYKGGEVFLWSRGEELVGERFPEITAAARKLPPGTALDGEILAWKDGQVLPFAALQRRIGRKTVGKRILADVPAAFLAFDLLERAGEDVRTWPLAQRRQQLEQILVESTGGAMVLSPPIQAASWEELQAIRDQSRARNVEGIMLKDLASPYATGRPRGLWWKWKIQPYSVDAVMIYAQLGNGKRASLYTDYTFGLWHEGQLVPFAKAYSGLTDEEIRQVDRWVRAHTIDKFGPVRAVEPLQVFEIAFEGIQRSTRHRSGTAVRFPRIARWRQDKQPADADTLATVQAMIRDVSLPISPSSEPTLF